MAGTPWVMSDREPSTAITRNPRNAIAAGVRMPSDMESTAVRDASPIVRSRVSVWRWCAKNAPRRGGARHLQLAQLGVVHRAQRLGTLAGRA